MSKHCKFLPQEILAITVGKLALQHSEKGISIEFIRYFLQRLNYNFELKAEGKKVQFDAFIPYENASGTFNDEFDIWGYTYQYDKSSGMFYVKKDFLYKVLCHFELVEERILDLWLSKAERRKLKCCEKTFIKKDIYDLLMLSLTETQKKFGL